MHMVILTYNTLLRHPNQPPNLFLGWGFFYDSCNLRGIDHIFDLFFDVLPGPSYCPALKTNHLDTNYLFVALFVNLLVGLLLSEAEALDVVVVVVPYDPCHVVVAPYDPCHAAVVVLVCFAYPHYPFVNVVVVVVVAAVGADS